MKNPESTARIIANLESALARALSSMTGKEFTVTYDREQIFDDPDTPIVWQQAFSFDPDAPALWLVAGKDLWRAAGQMTLAAVGIDSVTDEDCRSTWAEIAGQTLGGFATSVTSDIGREVNAARGESVVDEPVDIPWSVFTARPEGETSSLVRIGWSPAVAALYEKTEPEPKAATSGGSTFSKTFDLLLDVALPVSVSFGKTFLQIREVLKLNTGSIVELNRLVVEPVDVIVNDCVIARGEVVVVDGNYGVRVTQLASREDRLRTGMAETPVRLAIGAGGGA
ncbi:MAG: flagellar motor switch protein FliN [Bryobacterales bacterium]|jgi:flagellar motor switch protein FliN/FliY|nr:flagellar motor switch protein FliN [Bryobacterales bacterium]